MAFARKMVGRGRQGAVGPLLQGRSRGMKSDPLIRNVVESADGGAAGVVIVKLPGRDRAVLANAAGHFNDSGRAEVSPSELFLASPDDFDGFAGSLCQAGRF